MGKGRLVLIAPTERGDHVRWLRDVHTVETNLLPEGKGCDVLWSAHGSWYGVQRKEIQDLYASLSDGRMTKELGQMTHLGTVPWLIIEGALDKLRRVVTVEQHTKIVNTIADRGVKVLATRNAQETGKVIDALVESTWANKHKTGTTRPKAAGAWGTATSREWAVHLLQGFDGIGPEVAARIVEKFGGVPLAWTVGVEELMDVEGVGKVRAGKLINALRGTGVVGS